MTPKIKHLSSKKLVGKRLTMSLVENKTAELWHSFMSRHTEIQHAINNDLISIQVYTPGYFQNFNPTNTFEKWATAEVSSFEELPNEFETFILKEGLYAVFKYKGLSTDTRIFQYIFTEWLPNSGYELANRPHFEILGEKYKNNDPASEEEIWIPIQPQTQAVSKIASTT